MMTVLVGLIVFSVLLKITNTRIANISLLVNLLKMLKGNWEKCLK